MPENAEYKLQILLDGSGTTTEQMQQDCEQILHDHLASIDLQLISLQTGQLLLTLKGPLNHIDICHNEINKNLIEKSKRNCVRIVDDAGDHIRLQAYPMLAQIEQHFRAFINRATIEVFGFDWWDRLAPAPLKSKTLQTRNKDKEYGVLLHPLEYTQFDDLVDLITAEVSEWSDSRPLSAGDLLNFMSGCNSIADALAKLQDKMKKVSYWDSVFARYFQERAQWDQIKASLSFIIDQRHKVMHHRPIRLGTLEALRQHADKLNQLLDSAKTKLSNQEREEAQSEISEKLTLSSSMLNLDTESMQQLAESISVMKSPMTESMRQWAESMSVMKSPMTESMRQWAESMSVTKSPMTESMRQWAESMSVMKSPMTESMRQLAESMFVMNSSVADSIRQMSESMSIINTSVIQSIPNLAESLSAQAVQNLAPRNLSNSGSGTPEHRNRKKGVKKRSTTKK